MVLKGERLNELLRLFPDLEWSTPALADHFEMSPSTLLRHVAEATGVSSKAEAVRLHQEGK